MAEALSLDSEEALQHQHPKRRTATPKSLVQAIHKAGSKEAWRPPAFAEQNPSRVDSKHSTSIGKWKLPPLPGCNEGLPQKGPAWDPHGPSNTCSKHQRFEDKPWVGREIGHVVDQAFLLVFLRLQL